MAEPARMRQSLDEYEEAFAEEIELDRARRERLARTTQKRAHLRARSRVNRRGSFRYVMLVLSIVLTAVVVTVVMLRVLYVLLG